MNSMANNEPLKYNFVFYFAGEDYWEAVLGRELYNHPQVHIYKQAFNGSKLLQKIFHYHWAYSLNCKFNMPFKRIWFRKMYEQGFDNDLPLCFVYMGGNSIRFDGGFCDYVRKRDPRNMQVILHQDLISKKCNYDYSIIRNKVDLAITYDLDEAEKYNILYFHENMYSKMIPEPNPEDVVFENDVYFLGAPKDRYNKIMEVYEKLNAFGIKCKFMLAGVPEEKQVIKDGIEYIRGISYVENLQNVIKSKCILEIIQNGSADITMRALEAIAYRRKLLTDCKLVNEDYYHRKQLQVFDDADSIDVNFLKETFEPDKFIPRIDLDPMRRLYFIQEKLEKLNER